MGPGRRDEDLLKVESIDVFHGDLQALWNVSLEVHPGELVALVGSNGAGKTTIVETLSGLLRPNAGRILFNQERIDTAPTYTIVEQGISLVPEDKGVFPGMTVLENLEMGAFPRHLRRSRHEAFVSVYELFPVLNSRKQQLAGTLSGGERTMLAIGRALMARPRLLILDEPSLGLAPLVVRNIFGVIGRIQDSGVSTLLVEQNVRAALRIASMAYIVENGRISGEGDAKQLLDEGEMIRAYLSDA